MSKIFEALKKAGVDGAFLSSTRATVSPAAAAGPASEGEPEPDTDTLAAPVTAASPVWPYHGADPKAAEQYRLIRTRILQHPLQPHLIAISSPGPGDGKTITSINIAGVLALKKDAKVLLVDADFRRTGLARQLGLTAHLGLSDVLNGACPLWKALVRFEPLPNLYILPAGASRANPAELLDSENWRSAAAEFRKQFQFTILDAPPIGAVADYELIQVVADGLIVIIRPDHTDRDLCFKALDTASKEKLVGVVMNCAQPWFLWRHHDYYYYYSYEAH
jgi:capsular exopolysaccharide synthesis family protein